MSNNISAAQDRGSLFDAAYFKTGLGLPYERNDHWLNFFGLIADEIIRSLKPRTVFDAGCSMGFLVESLWDRSVEARGVDISAFAISQVRRDMRPYCWEASIVDRVSGRYDLVTCIEVLEHLPPEETEEAIDQITALSDTILFSSSPVDLTEPTHFNVRPAIGWLKLFANMGFWPDCVFDASFLAPHAMLLRKQEPLSPDVLALFSEKTRLKCALIEREQRIGGLKAKISDLGIVTADLDSVRSELSRTTSELQSSCAECEALAHELELVKTNSTGELESLKAKSASELELLRAESASQLEMLKAQAAIELEPFSTRSTGALESLKAESAKELEFHKAENTRLLNKLLAVTEQKARDSRELQVLRKALRRENKQLSDELLQLQSHYASRLNEAEATLREARATSAALQRDLNDSKGESFFLREQIAHINRSAAWQITSRYRTWMEDRRANSPWARLLDKGAKSVTKWAKNPAAMAAPAAESVPAPVPYEIGEVPTAILVAQPECLSEPIYAVAPEAESYESWYTRTEPSQDRLHFQRALSANLRLRPLISVLVPVYKVPLRVLEDMVESVQVQSYPYWELCITHAYPEDVACREYLVAISREDTRIKLILLEANQGIAGNSNAALNLVGGEFVALLDHDDALAPFALFEIATAINEHPDAGFLYSDKDCITEDGRTRLRPLFKPKWSPDTMLSANYLTHLSVLRTDLLLAAGGWKSETDGAQDWDIFLRVIDLGAKVVHVPGVLYHWRIISTSVASGGLESKPYAALGQVVTIDAHCERHGFNAKAAIDHRGVCKVDWAAEKAHSVAVILVPPVSAPETLEEWGRRVDSGTEWQSLEIIHASPNLPAVGRTRSGLSDDAASLPALLNRAVQSADGDYLVFLDQSIELPNRDWLKELLGPLDRTDVAIVAPKLLNAPGSTLRHAGLVFNRDGTLDYIFSNQPEHVYEQFGAAIWYRNWSAIAGGCFAVRRKAFLDAGGFRENPDFPRHDVDFCLRIIAGSKNRIVYNPFATFVQTQPSMLEAWLSPDAPQRGAAYIQEYFASGDPYFHPDLECRSGRVLYRSNRASARPNDYAAESRSLVSAFDADADVINLSRTQAKGPKTRSLQTVTWVLPQFVHPFYGGVHTILRFADYFLRAHGVESEFVYLGGVPEHVMQSRLTSAFPQLGATSKGIILRSYADWARASASDATICTLWTTAYAALHFKDTRRKFYFIQDYESAFYPAGSTYALAEATYRFGYYGICNTRSLKGMYQEFGGEAEYFDPCIDRRYFFAPAEPPSQSPPYRIFCYARPGHPRNCFELLTAAIIRLKQRLGAQVEIVSAGSEWNPADYGLDGIVENLGLIGYSATGALYRTCHAGVVLMMTRHPSYLPMEFMACGALVITNENRYTHWLLEHEKNCLLSDTTPSAVAAAIERGLTDSALRERLTLQAGKEINERYSDWDSQAEKIYTYIGTNV